jgi:hypothetical protein
LPAWSLQSDGKIVVAGHAALQQHSERFYIARFLPTASSTTTFGEFNRGYTVSDLSGKRYRRWRDRDAHRRRRRFIVSGDSGGMAAVKYTDNGLLDTGFGNGGKLRLLVGGVASIAPGPGRRFTIAGGADFTTARVLLAGAREVSAGVLDASADEGTTNTGQLFVGRTERLPVPTRVFFGVGGTAAFGIDRTTPRDYTMAG